MSRLFPVGTIAVVSAAVVVHLFPGLEEWLLFEREKIAAGEWWRLFTGHLVHISTSHLFWNVLLVLIAGWQLERRMRCAGVGILFLAVLVMGPALFMLDDALMSYAGLSGIAVTLIVGFAISEIRLGRMVFGGLMITFLLLKIGSEIPGGGLLLSDAAGHKPVPLAHFLGLICGLPALLLQDGSIWKTRRGGQESRRALSCPRS